MNNSIKRELSQACLSFAERENQRSAAGGKANFRPQVKRKLLSLLVLLCLTVSGAWAQTYDKTVNINEYGGDVEVTANQHWLITGTGSYTTNKIIIGENATVTLSGVNIITKTDTGSGNNLNYSCIQCKDYSNATIILDAGTTNRLTCTGDWCAAIQVGYESTLTIQGTGELEATGGQYGAGIGSNGLTTFGNIVIQGGNITATGGTYGAGIGSNGSTACGNIVIQGGNITATGGTYGAGIGAGNYGYCGNISINGGTVYAKAGSNAAGIGGGQGSESTSNGNCGNITINGGLVSVTDKGAVCIGSGQYSTCGAITITDGSFRLTNSNINTHDFIGKGGSGTCGTVTIDGVENAKQNSTFTHFKSDFTSTAWILTRDLYDVTANLADGAYWSTFYSESGHYKAPKGTQVFAVNLTGSTITMTEITDRIVKKGEGVVLRQATETESAAATTTIAMTLSLEAATGNFSTNSLKGTTISIPNPGNAYVLNNGLAGVGFYKLAAYNESTGVGTIGANKAYLTYDGALAREFFGFDETTGIKSMHNSSTSEAAKPSAQCTMHNDVFDLQGRRVAKPTKGLYIVNGKKVIIK